MFAEWIPTPDKHHSKAALVPGTATFTDYSENAKYLQHLLRKQHTCIMCSVQPWGNTLHPTSSVWCFSEDCDQKDYSSPQLVASACWMLLGIALKTTQTILPVTSGLKGITMRLLGEAGFKKVKVLHWESLKKILWLLVVCCGHLCFLDIDPIETWTWSLEFDTECRLSTADGKIPD